MPSRSWSFASQSSTVTPSPRMYTRRQEAHRRYLTRHGLQDLLERLFPNHPNLDFHIRLEESEVWSFDAPREVTQEELQEAFEE
jgi:hypothetical protein